MTAAFPERLRASVVAPASALALALTLALGLGLALVCVATAAAAQQGEPGRGPETEPPETPAGPVVVDLAAAVRLALDNNPALQAVEERREEVQAGVREVRADAFPQLAATSSYAISRNPAFLNSPDFEDLLDQFPEGSFEPSEQRLYSAGVEVSQPIYTFGKIGAALDLARLVVDATEAQIDAARLDAALAAADTYYEVLSARQSLAVGEVQQRVRREVLAVVRDRYDIGEATQLELLRAEASLAEVGPTLARLAGEVEVAESRLRRALGVPAGIEMRVEPVPGAPVVAEPPALAPVDEPGAEQAPSADAPPDADDYDLTPRGPSAEEVAARLAAGPERPADLPPAPDPARLYAAARRRRPEIVDLELQQRALLQRQKVTTAESRPQVDLDGFYGRQARLVDNLSDPLFDDYRLSLGLRWEFFDGGRRKGQIAQLESQRQQLGYRQQDLLAAIRLELEEALSDYRTALARWRASSTAATAAREASRVALEGYREGVALQTDLLDAERQQTEAEILAVEAYYDARQEAARLARAVGAYPTEGWDAAGAPQESER